MLGRHSRNSVSTAGLLTTMVIIAVRVIAQEPPARSFADFIRVMRPYIGGGYDNFQINNLKRLGFSYVQGLADFYWPNIEGHDDTWKWQATDAQMNKLAQNGMKIIAFVICPKSPGLPWDVTIERDDPRFIAEYEELAYEITKRYHGHRAWSGLVVVWGGSSDVWDPQYPLTDPEVVVPLINAAYDGIKRADPTSIVVGFNFATTATSKSMWETFHRRAFAMSPKFDWYGAQSHGVFTTMLKPSNSYGGVQGLANVRRFLDRNGYADKPLWLNEGGFLYGEDLGGLSEQAHAEQTVETFIVARTLDVDLRGWVYFELFGKEHIVEDFGLMTTLDQADPPQPRQAWAALQKLIQTVKFFDYDFDTQLSGTLNKTTPAFVYRFTHKNQASKRLWVVFSPRIKQVVDQAVTINISPATRATKTDMLGNTTTVYPDASGRITIQSTSSPVYIKAGG